jgi:cytochrome c oxidase subunit 2
MGKSIFLEVFYADAASPWQMGFQDPATPIMEGISNFHNDLMFFITFLAIFVTVLLVRCLYFFNEFKNKTSSNVIHGTTLEIIWTITPAIILIIIAIPSFSLLYSVDEIIDPAITLKVIGHQWYWSYEYSDYINQSGESIDFESYMIPEADLQEGHLRLLEVDNRLVLPTDTHIRVVVTSSDVLHCWAIPSFGTKLDACPGRLNQTSLYIKRPGTFYGQCSEICGINHGFMPIVIDAVSVQDYISWINSKNDC